MQFDVDFITIIQQIRIATLNRSSDKIVES